MLKFQSSIFEPLEVEEEETSRMGNHHIGKPIVKPEKYNPRTKSIKEWLDHYSKASMVNGWGDYEKLVMISFFLDGEAALW